MEAFTRLYAAVEAFPVPTVAVCVGNVVGAGAELAAGCDLRVGGDNLKLAWAGARHGVPVGPARLVPLVGLCRAKELVYTGRVVAPARPRRSLPEPRGARRRGPRARRWSWRARWPAGSPEALRQLKAMFRDLGGDAGRVAYENGLLTAFQRDGAGLPRGGYRTRSVSGSTGWPRPGGRWPCSP